MYSMKSILIVYAVILTLGILAITTNVHYYANVAGFISAVGFMLIFFKDPTTDMNEEKMEHIQKMKKYWYVVFGTGIFFSLILGSFWNNHLGGM